MAWDSRDLNQSAGYWPVLNLSQNPWQETFVEIEYSEEDLSQRILIAYTRSVLSGASAAGIVDHLTVVPTYFSWQFNDKITLSSVVELQKSRVTGETYDGQSIEGHEYQSAHTIGSIDLNHK